MSTTPQPDPADEPTTAPEPAPPEDLDFDQIRQTDDDSDLPDYEPARRDTEEGKD